MAGRRGRKRLKSLTQTLKDDGRVSANSDDPHTNVDLPTEILEQIFSQLSLRDNIRTSAVCKSWLAVATSLREPNKAPWLMLFPKSGAVYEFYNPVNRKRYCPRNRNYDWGEEDSGQSIWIDAPEDPSEFLQRGVLMIESYHVENIIHHHHQHQQMIEYSSFLEDFHSARKALVPPSIELQWRLRSCPLHRCLAIEPP